MMRLQQVVVRGFAVLYGVIAMVTGGRAMLYGLAGAAEAMSDNSFRFLAAIWLAAGLGFFHFARHHETETTLFRVLMLALFLGGVGRSLGLLQYPATPLMVALIALELIPPLFLVPMQGRLAARTHSQSTSGEKRGEIPAT